MSLRSRLIGGEAIFYLNLSKFNINFLRNIFLGALIGALFLFANVFFANAIGISPLTFEINVNPGDIITNFVTITNNDDSPSVVKMEAEDFGAVGEKGQVNIREDVPASLSAKKWLSFEPSAFTLGPQENKDVKFTIRVPFDAEPGGKYSSILASRGGGSSEGAVSVAQKVASLLLIRVAGNVTEALAVKSFSASSFYEYGPVDFVLRVENSGTVHLKPAGYISVKNIFGNEVAKLEISQQRVLPKSVREIDTKWNVKWGFGKYTADFLGVYGSTNEPLTAGLSFWIIPWKILSGIVVGLIVILFVLLRLRRRFFLALRVLFKGA